MRPGAPPDFVTWDRFLSSASRSEEHTSELQSQSNLVCRLLLEKKTVPLREVSQDARHRAAQDLHLFVVAQELALPAAVRKEFLPEEPVKTTILQPASPPRSDRINRVEGTTTQQSPR